MKRITMSILIMITLFGCGINQEKVDNIISQVQNYYSSEEFKSFIVRQCLEYDFQNIYESDKWGDSDTFPKILSLINSNEMVVNVEKKIVEENGIDYENFLSKCQKFAEKDELNDYETNKYWMTIYEVSGEVVSNQENYIENLTIDNPKNCIVKGKYYVDQKEFKKAISILKTGIPIIKELETLDNSFGTSEATFDMQELRISTQKDVAKKISYLLGYSYLMEKDGELAVKYSNIAWQCDESDSQTTFIMG